MSFTNKFQFTPLREGRRASAWRNRQCRNFNSRPSARGDQFQFVQGEVRHISIHAPPRGATKRACKSADSQSYFNSRPSARGDEISDKMGALWNISIHAPPRGATEIFLKVVIPLPSISIHAPPRGATIATADIIAA